MSESFEQLLVEFGTLKATVDQHSAWIDLSFPIISDIYKSRLIFWSLCHRFGHDVESRAMLLSKPGPHLPKEMQILSDARLLRSGKFTPPHLYARTSNNTIGELDNDTLARLVREVSTTLGLFTV